MQMQLFSTLQPGCTLLFVTLRQINKERNKEYVYIY